jgi:hypothetical protein
VDPWNISLLSWERSARVLWKRTLHVSATAAEIEALRRN